MTYIEHYRKYLKDWRLWAKLVLAILVLLGLLWSLIDGYVNISRTNYWNEINHNGQPGYDYGAYTSYFFSFFTHQSNLLILFWMLFALIFPWKEGKGILGSTSQILVGTYILITTIIFWCMLLPSNAVSGELATYGYQTWIYNVLLHAVSGIGFIFYIIFWSTKSNYHSGKDWFIKFSWYSLVFPIVYCVAILIRGELRYRSGKNPDTLYPYFFFEIHTRVNGMPGWIWLIIAIIIIAILCIGLSTLIAYGQNKIKDGNLGYVQKDNYRKELAN